MKEIITPFDDDFKTHYDRMMDDLYQVKGFTPAMQKLIKENLKNLKIDTFKKHKKLHGVINNAKKIYG